MVVMNTEVLSTLKGLIGVCQDAEAGYRHAAAEESSEELREIFTEYADQREEFLTDLKRAYAALGGKKEELPTVVDFSDAQHEFDESKALKLYEEALDKELPGDLHDLLERQSIQVEEAHEHLLEIKNLALADEEGNSDSPMDKTTDPDEDEPSADETGHVIE